MSAPSSAQAQYGTFTTPGVVVNPTGPSHLPFTGAPLPLIFVGSVALIGLGVFLVATAKRWPL